MCNNHEFGKVAGQRGLHDAPAPGADEIGDPIGASMEVVRASAVQIRDAVDSVSEILGLRR